MRKRSRKKADKKSGRKKPRIGDLDTSKINPAPDSILKTFDESSDDDFNLSMRNDFTESTPKQVKTTPRTPKSTLKNRPVNSESKKSLRFEKTCRSKTKLKIETSPKTLTAKNLYSILPSETKTKIKTEILDDKIKIPAKTPKLEKQEPLNVDIDLELSRSFEHDAPRNEFPWIESLYLDQTDKTLLLNYKKLHSGHMEAANLLARKDFPKIQGFTYIKDEGRWHVETVMEPVSGPACQIVHTQTHHWVVSVKDNEGNIYLFDSLGTERPERAILTPGL